MFVRLTSRQVRNAVSQQLTGLLFYNQRKSGGLWAGWRMAFFVFLKQTARFHHQFLPRVGQGRLLVPVWSGQDCPYSTLEKYFQVSVQWGFFILKSHLSINDCFLCAHSMFWGSLTWRHHWASCRLYSLLLFYCLGVIVQRTCLQGQSACFWGY